MERSTTALIRKMELDAPMLDVRLPAWARRSNPIVRRHLGVYVKTIPPQVGPLANLYFAQAAVVLLTIPLPFVFNVTLPLITVSLLLLPLAFLAYAQVLLNVTIDSVMTMLPEVANDTLTLLRTTPLTLNHILLGKIASALWRRIDDLNLIILAATLFSLPPIILEMAQSWPPDKYPYISQLGIILLLAAAIIRLMLEPFMIAAMGVLVGTAAPVRTTAITVTLLLTFFYFLLINLPRFLLLSFSMRMVVTVILPLALPLFVTWGALRLTSYLITRD